MDTKEFKIGDRIQFTAGDVIEGTVVQVRDYEPSLGVIWDGYTKITWYISSSGVFNKVDDDICDEDKHLVTDIINNVKAINDGLPSVEEVMSAWKKAIKELEDEGELKLKVEEDIEVGDRVEYIGGCSDGFLNVGEQGVVVVVEKPEPLFGVRWDNYYEYKNDLYGNCDDCYGLWVSKEHIRKIKDKLEDLENDDKKPVLSPKEMLKAGMVVEMADGDFGLFDGERILYHDGFDEITGLDDDLQDIYVSHKMDVYDTSDKFSIVAIYQPTCGYTLQTLNIKVGKFEVIWKKEGFVRKFKKEFSKDELIILENIHHDGYEYIARNKDGETMLFVSDKIKKLVTCWSSECGVGVGLKYVEGLFQCISWEDEEPVKISDFI